MAAKSSRVLVSGASFAGLSTAYWLLEDGVDVTIVELAGFIRQGGTPVNIKDDTVALVDRLGILEDIKKNNIAARLTELWTPQGMQNVPAFFKDNGPESSVEYEVDRRFLLSLLFERVKNKASITFGDSVASLQDNGQVVEVIFASGRRESYDLVIGCDGLHSKVRQCVFGDESQFSYSLHAYGSVTTLDKLLVQQKTAVMYQEPGKALILSAYDKKTDIVTTFRVSEDVPRHVRSRAQSLKFISEQFQRDFWRLPEIVDEMENADNLYFAELVQIRMPTWTRGRVALVGDAGYCASPAAGRGRSLAIDGAAALTDAIKREGRDHKRAFARYESGFRPFIAQVQEEAVQFCAQFLGDAED